jgi:inosine-uridine nucleoside N-ribohydrolase
LLRWLLEHFPQEDAIRYHYQYGLDPKYGDYKPLHDLMPFLILGNLELVQGFSAQVSVVTDAERRGQLETRHDESAPLFVAVRPSDMEAFSAEMLHWLVRAGQ